MKDLMYAVTVFLGMIGVVGFLFTFVIFFAFIFIQLRDFVEAGRRKEEKRRRRAAGRS